MSDAALTVTSVERGFYVVPDVVTIKVLKTESFRATNGKRYSATEGDTFTFRWWNRASHHFMRGEKLTLLRGAQLLGKRFF